VERNILLIVRQAFPVLLAKIRHETPSGREVASGRAIGGSVNVLTEFRSSSTLLVTLCQRDQFFHSGCNSRSIRARRFCTEAACRRRRGSVCAGGNGDVRSRDRCQAALFPTVMPNRFGESCVIFGPLPLAIILFPVLVEMRFNRHHSWKNKI